MWLQIDDFEWVEDEIYLRPYWLVWIFILLRFVESKNIHCFLSLWKFCLVLGSFCVEQRMQINTLKWFINLWNCSVPFFGWCHKWCFPCRSKTYRKSKPSEKTAKTHKRVTSVALPKAIIAVRFCRSSEKWKLWGVSQEAMGWTVSKILLRQCRCKAHRAGIHRLKAGPRCICKYFENEAWLGVNSISEIMQY